MVPFQVLQGHLRPRLAGAAQAGSVERGQTLGATQQRPRSHRVVHVVVWSGDGGGVQRDPAEPSPLQEGGAPFGAGCGCLGLLFREHSRGLFRAGRQGRGTRGPSAGRRGPGLHGAGVRSRPGRRPGPPQSPRCQMPHSGLPRRREDGAVRPARPLGPCAPPSLSPQHPCLRQGGLYPAHFTGEGTGARRETHCCGLRVLSGTGGNRPAGRPLPLCPRQARRPPLGPQKLGAVAAWGAAQAQAPWWSRPQPLLLSTCSLRPRPEAPRPQAAQLPLGGCGSVCWSLLLLGATGRRTCLLPAAAPDLAVLQALSSRKPSWAPAPWMAHVLLVGWGVSLFPQAA